MFEVTEQVANTIVNITVTRNENAPKFTLSQYRKDRLPEKTSVGENVITVNATDRDNVNYCYIKF